MLLEKFFLKKITAVSVVCMLLVSMMSGCGTDDEEYITIDVEEDYAVLGHLDESYYVHLSDDSGEKVSTSMKTIACWGDSITFGLGSEEGIIVDDGEAVDITGWAYTDVLSYYTGMYVYNLGVCGETSREVALRQGGEEMYLAKSVTIKKGKRTRVSIVDGDGNMVSLENFNGYGDVGGGQDNIVYIADKPYLITYSAKGMYISAYSEMEVDSIKLDKGALIETQAAHDIHSDVLIIQMGSNGGWETYDDLIEQYKAMIEKSGIDEYIIIGDTDNTSESYDSDSYELDEDVGLNDSFWEAALKEAFGDHFINMRTYLIENGIELTGIGTTKDDETDLKDGRVPRSLKYDYTHLNAYGYYVVGYAVYEKGVQLGYWE